LFIAFRRIEGTAGPASLARGAITIDRVDEPSGYTGVMRVFSFLFASIALVMLALFLIYVFRGPVDPLIAGGLFVSFLVCLVPALLLLKPFEPPEELRRRREQFRREREERRRSSDGSRRGSGS
jgi:L-lactate permease